MNQNRPCVAVSACLLGQRVRYDGRDKYTSLIAEELENYCHLLPVCPEVEIGLGVPRAKIQLTQVGTKIRVLQADDPSKDYSQALIDFSTSYVSQCSLSGMILQDKSPSCGINNTKVFSQSGDLIGLGSGLFATTIMELLPELVVIQASQLQTSADVEQFVNRLAAAQ